MVGCAAEVPRKVKRRTDIPAEATARRAVNTLPGAGAKGAAPRHGGSVEAKAPAKADAEVWASAQSPSKGNGGLPRPLQGETPPFGPLCQAALASAPALLAGLATIRIP